MKFLITGGTGFIGSFLCQSRLALGDAVTVLTRDVAHAKTVLPQGINFINTLAKHQDAYDVIINLAGEPLNHGRWAREKKNKIYTSRLGTTKKLVDFILNGPTKPKLLISGSAIGFYGSSPNLEFTEKSKAADAGFTHDLCAKWEAFAFRAEEEGVRVCTLRTGIVLGTEGGALKEMLLPFRLGLGAKIAGGMQWMSWIHKDDVIGIINHIVAEKSIYGPVNLTAPHSVTNAEFTQALARILHRPAFLTIPPWLLKLLFGEMGEVLLQRGQRVLPQKMLDAGYRFLFPTIGAAFRNLFPAGV